MLHFSFARKKEHHHHHHLFRSAKKRTDPSSSWVNGETSRWVRAVRQPRRTRERRTTSVESAAVGFIQFIIRARSDDIFLSFSLCDKTQQASVTGKKTLLLERGFLLALKRRKGVSLFLLPFWVRERRKQKRVRFDSESGIRSKIVALRKREKTALLCRRRAKTRLEIGRYRFDFSRESRFDTFESDLRRLGRMPFWYK